MKITLKNGIKITDNRRLGCGLYIEQVNSKYMTLFYNSNDGFYINTVSRWLSKKEATEMRDQLTEMIEAQTEADNLL